MGKARSSISRLRRLPIDTPLHFEKIDQLVDQLKELATSSFQQGQSIDKTEAVLYKHLMSLGHALVQAIVQGAGDVGPSIDKNGRSYKRLPKRTRRYRSIFGDFRIERFVYGTATNEAIQVK